jgi:hypothetical protein
VDCGLVFVREGGRAPHPHRFNRLFSTATRTAGLPRIRFHDYADLRVMPTSPDVAWSDDLIAVDLSA